MFFLHIYSRALIDGYLFTTAWIFCREYELVFCREVEEY